MIEPRHIQKVLVRMGGKLVGNIVLTADDLCAFQYDKAWLHYGFSISPFELPLQNNVFIANRNPFDGGLGVFDDCLPDGWGSLILDRLMQKNGVNPRSLTLLDRLSLVGGSGRGALCFEPDNNIHDDFTISNIDHLAAEAEAVLSSADYNGEGIENLYRRGGSPGGARPKVFAKIDGEEWLIKFPANNDSKSIGEMEYKYSLLARQCGVEMPETRLVEGKYFAVKRFDRKANGERIHCVSIAGLLQADYRIPCIDYSHIFRVCQRLTRNQSELWKVFMLMCFNYAIGNKDDHAKNFSFLCENGEWRFSPAYDLLPCDGLNGYHTTSFNNSITPSPNDILSLAAKFGLNATEAKQRLDKILAQVQRFVA